MDLGDLRDTVANAPAVAPVGARTQWAVGGRVATATEVRAPAGIVHYEPKDMTLTVGAATPYSEVAAVLAEHGQECALDPRTPDATVGGILASGLSGYRRLRTGPVRDHVLEVRMVLADGRVVKGGGPTVKNVTGYDLCRLFVGSLGTLGVLTQATLRCRPRPAVQRWLVSGTLPEACTRPAAVLWDGRDTHVLLEGHAPDVAEQAGSFREAAAPALPEGAHRGRISVAPGAVVATGTALAAETDLRWCAEVGVGTIHVAGDDASVLDRARTIAHAHDGWLLREAGGADDNGFGRDFPNAIVMRRIKAAFDPGNKLSPGRLPL